jgi:hypothetical protein
MKKKFPRSRFALLTLMASISVLMPRLASAVTDLQNVTIVSLATNRSTGYVYIRASVAPVVGGCLVDGNWNFVLPIQTDMDKALYSALLAAQAQKAKVRLYGTGTCAVGVELLSTVFTYN